MTDPFILAAQACGHDGPRVECPVCVRIAAVVEVARAEGQHAAASQFYAQNLHLQAEVIRLRRQLGLPDD